MVEISTVLTQMEYWIQNCKEQCHHVVNSGMHGLVSAHRDQYVKQIFNTIDLFSPDGILMIWLARYKGFKIRKAHTGPGLLWEFASLANEKGYSNYFYGDEEVVLSRLTSKLREAFPEIKISGYTAPPFRDLTAAEDAEHLKLINDAKPDVLWVGLGMPKQEKWIYEHRDGLQVSVAIGAGAAFKLISGDISRGPVWMRNSGFEWLWRLVQEPRRIWRRVFIDAPLFVVLVICEILKIRKY